MFFLMRFVAPWPNRRDLRVCSQTGLCCAMEPFSTLDPPKGGGVWTATSSPACASYNAWPLASAPRLHATWNPWGSPPGRHPLPIAKSNVYPSKWRPSVPRRSGRRSHDIFHRLPHVAQVQKMVMALSAPRVCFCCHDTSALSHPRQRSVDEVTANAPTLSYFWRSISVIASG